MKETKNNPGGRREGGDGRGLVRKSLLGALDHGWQCACCSQMPSFLRSKEGFRNPNALKEQKWKGVRDATSVISATAPPHTGGRMLQTCPHELDSGCLRGFLHLSQGARVWEQQGV